MIPANKTGGSCMGTYSAPKDFRRAPWRLVLLAVSLCLFSGHAFGQESEPDPELRHIKHIVVIYQENWSFDSLYGLFPGVNGLAQSSPKSLNQTDRFDHPLSAQTGQPFSLVSGSLKLTTPPPPINNGQIDMRFTPGLNTLLSYNVLKNSNLMPNDTTGDLVHRFWHEQSQIDHGAMDWFFTWSDNPGLTMSYFDATNMPEGLLAQKYTLADNFFHASFGGSFLNHQFLISAAAPVYPNGPAGMRAVLDTDGQLLVNPATASARRTSVGSGTLAAGTMPWPARPATPPTTASFLRTLPSIPCSNGTTNPSPIMTTMLRSRMASAIRYPRHTCRMKTTSSWI